MGLLVERAIHCNQRSLSNSNEYYTGARVTLRFIKRVLIRLMKKQSRRFPDASRDSILKARQLVTKLAATY